MKRLAILAAIAGTCVIAGAIWAADPAAVADAVARAGAATFLVIGVRAISMVGAGWAWWLLLPSKKPHPRVCVLLRIVREGGNTLLPFTHVGGDVIGARLLTFWGIAGALAAASVIVDILLQAVTQFIFALTALALLALRGSSHALVRELMAGFVVAI